MSHRERMLAAVNHQPIDEFPTDIQAVPEMWEKLEAHFGIKKVIVGESETFSGTREFLEQHGVEVVYLDLDSCKQLMSEFINDNLALWKEDIGKL